MGRFFYNDRRTGGRIALKFCIAYGASFAQLWAIFVSPGPVRSHGYDVTSRHMPGSQPPFSLIPDPYQNKEDTPFISVVVYGVYIPLPHPI